MIDSWDLWAKTDREQEERWHALPWHLIEVGAVAQLLWQKALPQQSRDRICTRLGLSEDETGRLVGFLAALHDLGKASPRFQSMSDKQVERLRAKYGAEFTKDTNKTALRHSLISWKLLVPLFEREFGWTYRISRRYGEITAAHHGRFWTSSEFAALDGPDTIKRTGQKTWADLHHDIFSQLREAFGIDGSLMAKLNAEYTYEPNFPTYEDSLWLTGLIAVADWIGSDEHYFKFRPEPAASYADALKISNESAENALRLTGWASPPLTITSGEINDTIITVENFDPNNAQCRVVELTRAMTSPGMTVIEIPMGRGKTEIALWIAAYYAETAAITGTYFALPTMATSDQLYQRVQAHLKAHADKEKRTRIVPLHLLHGMAEFSTMDETQPEAHLRGISETSVMDEMESEIDDIDSMQATAERIDAQADPDADPRDQVVDAHNVVRRARWFTRRKHGLLARYGVGTVDQALMSVLRTPHQFVRMFGLSGKTVVFDEVHSYDVYMSSLFDRLLEFLGAMGSPVVILSATLPQHRTREMLAAYARGARWNVDIGELAPYPRISAIDDTRMKSVEVERGAKDVSTSVQVEWYPCDPEKMWDDLATRLKHELGGGGTVAVICNTVASAQACFTRLQQTFAEDPMTLFHARFRQQERADIQKQVLESFGKDAGKEGKPARPFRHIVVATQVIEQSLDLDFDLMVSMFAPTDLLLQRAGRLQRHSKWRDQRPDAFRDQPRLWLIGLDKINGNEGPDFFEGSKRIYSDYVLLRSWFALSGREQIVIPETVEELIEATYGDDPSVPDEIIQRYERSRSDWIKKTTIDSHQAELALIPEVSEEIDDSSTDVLVSLSQMYRDPEENPNAHPSLIANTRLGPPTISVVVMTKVEANERMDLIDDETEGDLSKEEVACLLRCSLSVSDKRFLDAMRLKPTPKRWGSSAHLRYRYLLVLEEGTATVVGETKVKLDQTLGLLIGDQAEGEEGVFE